MVLYYNPCNSMSMFSSGTSHRQNVTSATAFNFVPATNGSTVGQQNSYSPYYSSPVLTTPTSDSSVSVAPPSSSPQYSLNMPAGLPHPSMSADLQAQSMSNHHHWYSLSSSTNSCGVRGPGSVIAGSPFDDCVGPNSSSPMSAGSPVTPLAPCAYAMPMPSPYGQPLQVGPYHRTDHYVDHHPHHYHTYGSSGLLQQIGNHGGGATPVHPSPDSGLTASSDGVVSGTESPPGQNRIITNGADGNTVIGSENSNGASNGSNRPQPARSPYEWMKKPSYQNQVNPGKTRTKDKYRVVYSDHQRLELEKEFHYSRYITIRRKSELAGMLGLSERQVKIWFQNRRAKERKQAKKREEIIKKEKEHHVHLHSQQMHPLHSLLN